MDYTGTIFLVLVFIVLVIFVEWKIGTAIGKAVTQGTGLVLGILLILLGFTIFIAIPIIMYSNKNKSDREPLNLPAANLNLNVNKTGEGINLTKPMEGQTETRECPFCAETIKKKAIVCRFFGKTIEPIL